jgi:hypothetical protein
MLFHSYFKNGELSIKAKVNKKSGGNYFVKINVSDPQNNSASRTFEIAVTRAIPKFAITTADVSTIFLGASATSKTVNVATRYPLLPPVCCRCFYARKFR